MLPCWYYISGNSITVLECRVHSVYCYHAGNLFLVILSLFLSVEYILYIPSMLVLYFWYFYHCSWVWTTFCGLLPGWYYISGISITVLECRVHSAYPYMLVLYFWYFYHCSSVKSTFCLSLACCYYISGISITVLECRVHSVYCFHAGIIFLVFLSLFFSVEYILCIATMLVIDFWLFYHCSWV